VVPVPRDDIYEHYDYPERYLLMEKDIKKVNGIAMKQNDIIDAITFSPDGRCVASGSAYTVVLWSVETERKICELKTNGMRQCIVFSPDGQYLMVCSGDAIIIYREDMLVCPLRHDRNVMVCAISSCGRYLASGYTRGQVIVYDLKTGEKIRNFQLGDEVHTLSFSADSRYLAAGSWVYNDHGKVAVWNIKTGKKIREYNCSPDDGPSLSFSPDGRYLLVGMTNARVHVYEWQTKRSVSVANCHGRRETWSCQWFRRFFAWTGTLEREVSMYEQLPGKFLSVGLSRRGFLATGGDHGHIKIFREGKNES